VYFVEQIRTTAKIQTVFAMSKHVPVFTFTTVVENKVEAKKSGASPAFYRELR